MLSLIRKFLNLFKKSRVVQVVDQPRKRYIIADETMAKADFVRQKMGLKREDCILLSGKCRHNDDKIRGLYKDVMEDRIELIGLNKAYFEYLYSGGRNFLYGSDIN